MFAVLPQIDRRSSISHIGAVKHPTNINQVPMLDKWKSKKHSFDWILILFPLLNSVFAFELNAGAVIVNSKSFIVTFPTYSSHISAFLMGTIFSRLPCYVELGDQLLITLIKCLKGHRSLGSLFEWQLVKSSVSQWLSQWVSDKVTYWAVLDS